jgi:hypothetical protein
MAIDLFLPDLIYTHMPWPGNYAFQIGLSLRHQLNYRIAQFRKALTLLGPRDPRRAAFKVALRKAYARRRYYKRLYGDNRLLWLFDREAIRKLIEEEESDAE